MKAEPKAPTFSRVQASSAKVAPVTTMDSPSAMMMKPAHRSAIWPPSTTQSETSDAPYFGIQNRTAGETYSIASATAHSVSRALPCAKPPAIQKTAEIDSQAVIRIAFIRATIRERGVDSHRNTVLPTCIAAYAKANHNPRDSNAWGIEVESTSPPSISENSRMRTGVSSGLSQLVIQEV